MRKRLSIPQNFKFCAHSTRRKVIWSVYKPSSTSHGYVSFCPPPPKPPPPLVSLPKFAYDIQTLILIFVLKQGLVKSTRRDDQQLGVVLLSEIFRTSPERRRECLYYLALGNFKLGNYAEARRYNDLLLQKEPANLQASNLRTLIDDKVAKEGLMGVAIVSGIAVAAGVIGGVLMRNMGRKR